MKHIGWVKDTDPVTYLVLPDGRSFHIFWTSYGVEPIYTEVQPIDVATDVHGGTWRPANSIEWVEHVKKNARQPSDPVVFKEIK